MASEWPKVALSEVAKLRSGFSFKSADWVDDGVPVIKIGNVKDGRIVRDGCGFVSNEIASTVPEWVTKDGDILIAMTGYVGEVALVRPNERYLINQRVGRFDFLDSSPVLPGFLYCYLRSPAVRAYIEDLARGSAQPNLSAGDAAKVMIPVPPIAEQRAIAETLGALDGRIDNLRQTNATLEAIAQALFKSWFVDFDGVPPEDMQESELRLIPKGWRVGRFDEAIDILGGGTPKTSIVEYWDGDIPWFSVVDAPTDGQVFVLDTEKKITALGLKNCSAKLLPEMTTIISARGTVGKVAMTGVPMAMNQSCYALRPKQQGGEAFVYFSTRRFVEQLQRIAHGAVFDTITRDSFKQVTTSLAPDKVIANFGETVNPLLLRIRANGQQVDTLASLRDTLLPRLISGQLRVKL